MTETRGDSLTILIINGQGPRGDDRRLRHRPSTPIEDHLIDWLTTGLVRVGSQYAWKNSLAPVHSRKSTSPKALFGKTRPLADLHSHGGSNFVLVHRGAVEHRNSNSTRLLPSALQG